MLNAALRQRAEAHFRRLAERHGVNVRRTKDWMSSECDWRNRRVFVPRTFDTGLKYLVALHEIGHLVVPAARGWLDGRPGDVLKIEAAAWAWAVTNADDEVIAAMTKTDWRRVGHCWASHAGEVW